MRFEKRVRWRIGFLRVTLAQIRTGRPPEVRATYERLTASGVSPWRAYRLLAAAYEAEVATMLIETRVYSAAAYRRHLDRLPETPSVSLSSVSATGAS